MKTKIIIVLCITIAALIGSNILLVNKIHRQQRTISSYIDHQEDRIIGNLINCFGDRLVETYGNGDSNWIDDVACEMDWDRLVNLILDLPHFNNADLMVLDEATEYIIEDIECIPVEE